MRSSIVATCLAAAVLASPREASAGIFLGGEYDAGQGLDLPSGTRTGYGFVASFGYRIGLGPVFLQPEAQGSYMRFPTDAGTASTVTRALGGARFGLAGIFQPALYAHMGMGWLDRYTNGPALDAGLSLAFKLIPVLSFGGQAGYNVVMITSTGASTRWLSYGAHIAVDF
jgi:hypothetical protein